MHVPVAYALSALSQVTAHSGWVSSTLFVPGADLILTTSGSWLVRGFYIAVNWSNAAVLSVAGSSGELALSQVALNDL
jgi:hypothetical protein